MEIENPRQVKWADMKEGESSESSSMEPSSTNDSEPSSSSSLSEDMEDDATSSSTLFEFADLMAQLPKRGLSKFYHGKSESFTSLLSIRSVEDLAKKEICFSKRMKRYKSYGSNLNRHKFSPKATIAKKSPKGTLINIFT